jgi:hypothetical protein
LIAHVRVAVQAWRKREGRSRESIVQGIVETFEALGGPDAIGLRFEPETRDPFERTKVNADRVFRWLDDDSKDNNLLPANFLPYVLAALPVDLRIRCVDELLQPAGLTVRMASSDPLALDAATLIKSVAKEGGEATSALAALVDGADPGELESAQQELTESIAAQQLALEQVEAALAQRARG